MAATLYLVRHGATGGDEERRYKGSLDVPLSPKGQEQINITSAVIKRMATKEAEPSSGKQGLSPGLTAVYSSPLCRALKSAELIAAPFGLTPEVIPDLRERCFGLWEGFTFSEIREQYPKEFTAWIGNPLEFCPVGGESTRDVSRRVENALNSIIARHKEEQFAIAAHGGVNRIILCLLTGIPLTNIFCLEQDYAAINIIEFHDGFPVVKAMNLAPWKHYG